MYILTIEFEFDDEEEAQLFGESQMGIEGALTYSWEEVDA